MRRLRAEWMGAALLLVASTTRADEGALRCDAQCPEGTSRSEFSTSEEQIVAGTEGGFVYARQQCESFCVPTVPCLPPNVPTVTQERFACQPLSGFSTIPKDHEVDLSFGTSWDAAAAAP